MTFRSVPLFFLFLVSGFVLAQVDYQHGILILADGRSVAIRGEIEVLGDEVQFTDGLGELMVLPLDRVDLVETKRRNEEIRSKSSSATPVTPDGSLYSEVTNFQLQEKKDGKKREIIIEKADKAPQSSRKHYDSSQPTVSQLNDIPTLAFLNQEQVEELVRQFEEKMNKTPNLDLILKVAGLFLLIFVLMSLFSQIYMIIISFREGFFWWFSLMACFLGPIILNVSGWFLGATNLVFTMGPSILSLLGLIMFPAFIIMCCEGRRLRLFFFYGMTFIWLIVCIAALVVWWFMVV